MHHTPIKYKSLGIIIYRERVNLYLCVHAKSLQSCPTLCNPKGYSPPGSSVHGYFPCKNAGVCCHAFLQGIFLTQDLTRVSCISCIAGGFFTHWATWEAQYTYIYMYIHTYTYIYMYIYIWSSGDGNMQPRLWPIVPKQEMLLWTSGTKTLFIQQAPKGRYLLIKTLSDDWVVFQ